MIPYSHIGGVLSKTRGDTPIKIKYLKTDLLTVYITKVTNSAVWATHVNLVQEIRIFPTKKVEILQIGKDKVGSQKDLIEAEKAYKEYMQEKKRKEKQQMYRDALRHQRELGNGQPIK